MLVTHVILRALVIGARCPVAITDRELYVRADESLFDKAILHRESHIFINRAGVGLLVLNSELRQQFKNPVWLNF